MARAWPTQKAIYWRRRAASDPSPVNIRPAPTLIGASLRRAVTDWFSHGSTFFTEKYQFENHKSNLEISKIGTLYSFKF